ncbi:MAG: hypothetical protein NW201_07045 [Gemmatimonadales bacterium]|nr:hypothetical protein [Gemmatimonadales bacterium]
MSQETKQQLLEALQESVRTEAEKRAIANAPRRPPPRTRPALVAALAGAIVASLGVLLVRPAWLFPPPPPLQSPAESDASLRAVMYLQAETIFRFRATRHRLPETLAEAGGIMPTPVRYVMVDPQRFRLEAVEGPTQLTYRSDQDLAGFLGGSMNVLVRRGRQGGARSS